jgi:hypothetical protein
VAYVRKKRVGEREYYQVVEGHREDGKVKQRVLAHLGRYPTVREALEHLPESIARRRRTLSRYPKKIQPGMERRIAQDERRLANFRRLHERGVA